ncbi:hypothetical protein AP460_00064 [Actinobacillus pleuropneumoniae]|uniref:Extracellular endo-alpha-(1->5)-L-arabinanase C-terminal domain-containing protein n=2 Tax=Actinobacillus pleuropneumoniae TaxID=715 RepID=A3N3Y1_ACTP2|nr:hypothetical protein [Actinobacillus pleuropneumoniae]ABN75117.1 hypothetical protein APL_2043 [Actinobacillus pleuropneumoniae serovar 5b str. L20]EFL79435.1 hypothetical protein APP2_0141 [Actinobacillus pleuropneumoniae serovar 2 str. 4226]EFM86604.1 hypothetical protein appser2_20820 [Actinobacillus pleuropneumoniae serovar 2 str. S1536]EFN01633.1 hypothetical protein appser12_240 [Actinobacillus pleuropneumoniae serovar 12 str. 1096]KIE87867.1 hypothetical protein AP1022_02441 [Actinob
MKKIILAATVSLLAACSYNNQTSTANEPMSAKSFVGNWECRMDGGNIATNNNVTLSKDGKATYLGKVMLPNDKPLFQYDVKRTGSWSYDHKQLTYKFIDGTIARAHSAEIQQALKTDKKLNTTEQKYYEAINNQLAKAEQKPLNIEVSNFAPNAFSIKQNIGGTARTGLCVRPNK